jgi:site-specific DNA-methyltransferase (adenine-specific)
MTAVPRNTIINGDARERLRELPAASLDCVITSPPYFAVRDYGHSRQIGHEADVVACASQLRMVFAEVARVAKPTGALWLNLGDGYAHGPGEGAPRKSLLLAPSEWPWRSAPTAGCCATKSSGPRPIRCRAPFVTGSAAPTKSSIS